MKDLSYEKSIGVTKCDGGIVIIDGDIFEINSNDIYVYKDGKIVAWFNKENVDYISFV